MQGFVDCMACMKWSDIPAGFSELKHFAKCPECGQAMYLTRNITPEELGLRQQNKVQAGLMLNNMNGN